MATTPLYLPDSLPYPIRISSIEASVSSTVTRGTRLLSYSYTFTPEPDPDGNQRPNETRFGTWDMPVEGTVERWNFRQGQTVFFQMANGTPALLVKEPCTHDVQAFGLCALCGKDMTNADYTGYSDASRASIRMTHDANGPTVSLREAQRLEKKTAQHLYKSRKLSLIVDLDQTIVHATVDPTVGEWISGGEAWESRKAKSLEENSESVNPEGGEDDEVNPNWDALKDVKKFRLAPESFASHSRVKGKGKARVEDEGCLYYIKPRPGWKSFMEHAATKYEMHVYTMGTRAYAEQVCAALDPDRKIFGDRILSRDESGSMTQKNLHRLFPSDHSMVVIIDDRADVWEWSPNLVKVIPYDFFVGIGDINSAFLPKLDPIAALPGPKPSSTSTNGESADGKAPNTVNPSDLSASSAGTPADAAQAAEEAEADAVMSKATEVLDAQLEERPLAKMQEELSVKDSNEADSLKVPTDSKSGDSSQIDSESEQKKEKTSRKALLTNNDHELVRVQALLDYVHKTFYDAYDMRHSGKFKADQKPYDVRNIIPGMRSKTLAGVYLVFSSVIPLDTRPDTTDIWRTARAFGAVCSTEISDKTTHVVAAKRGTAKVDTARRRGGIHVVWLSWFTDSIALWARQPEDRYRLDTPSDVLELSAAVAEAGQGEAGTSSTAGQPEAERELDDSQVGSSDLDVDTDWDEDDEDPDSVPVTPSKLHATTTEEPASSTAEMALTGKPRDEDSSGDPPAVEVDLDFDAWAELNKDVEEALAGSDDDDVDADEEYASEQGDTDMDDDTPSEAPFMPTRKRLRSLTPSEVNGVNGSASDDDSPSKKRKKMGSGTSPLKQSVSAGGSPRSISSRAGSVDGSQDGTETLDDFLAGEEWE